MFSSANNNSDDPDLDSMFKRPNSNFQLSDILVQNPISKPSDHIDHDPPFFSNFPSPFLDEYESPLNQILHHNLLMAAAADQTHQNKDSQEYSTKKERNTAKRSTGLSKKLKEKAVIDHNQPISRRNLGVVQRKRTGKKDRHSKICTAQGIRDRRMRLSLQVARKFFDLQDMLGYDKASKTIEWLFNKSKKAIKDLTKDHNPQGNNKNIINISMLSDAKSESFLSECEVVSGIEEISNNEIRGGIINLPNKGETEKTRKKTKPNLRSESREKARARARYRTIEKMMIKQLENCKSSPNQNDAQKLGSSIDQESGERVSPYDADGFTPSLMQQIIADEGTIEKLLLGNSSSDPNSNFMGFLGNWELLYNDKMNSSQFAVTNQVPLAAEQLISSEYSSAATPNFPLFQQ